MATNTRWCSNCGEAEAIKLGLVPETILNGVRTENPNDTYQWAKANMCPHCGEIEREEVTEEEATRAADKIYDLYEEHEIVD